MSQTVDVIVIGAGFTGLCAALELKRKSISFLLLEASERVGGKVESHFNSLGERLDTGGQFFCQDMPSLMELARRYEKTFVETPIRGVPTAQPPAGAEDVARIHRLMNAMRDRMNLIDPDAPEIADLTVADWLARQSGAPDVKNAFHSMVEGLWCQPMDKVPLWYLIDNDRRITNETYELQYFLKETLHSLAEDMAAKLGDRLLLGAAAIRIAHRKDGVTVHTHHAAFNGRRVIVALPPSMAARLAFVPALPEPIVGALDAWKSGSVIKTLIRYERPFWRDKGLSGMVMWRDVHGLFACETSADDGHAALVVWTAGPLARDWRRSGEGELRKRLVDRLSAALGPEAGKPLDILLRDWTDDRWTGGGYSDIIMDVAAHDAETMLRDGFGVVQFASSEISPSFPGYVEGAIVAGRIAAGEADNRINKHRGVTA